MPQTSVHSVHLIGKEKQTNVKKKDLFNWPVLQSYSTVKCDTVCCNTLLELSLLHLIKTHKFIDSIKALPFFLILYFFVNIPK